MQCSKKTVSVTLSAGDQQATLKDCILKKPLGVFHTDGITELEIRSETWDTCLGEGCSWDALLGLGIGTWMWTVTYWVLIALAVAFAIWFICLVMSSMNKQANVIQIQKEKKG